MSGVFKDWAQLYREAGFWPRPVRPGTKTCPLTSWQKPDPDWPEPVLQQWLSFHGDCGIGLVMGSPFPDGTMLGALDVDCDECLRLARTLLGNPACVRIGKKGAVFFVRVQPGVKNRKFRVKGEAGEKSGQVAECLFYKSFCVIPPTVHPDTGTPYRWEGPSLLDTGYQDLPLISE
jgi:hypothetical protein